MNIKDAIELNENELNRLKIKKDNLEYIRETHTDEYKHLSSNIEALSIVLESVKLLNKHLDYSDKEYEEEDVTMDVISIRFDDPIYLNQTEAGMIGYELNSDYEWDKGQAND